MKLPSLAILITTYNGQRFIGELLDNVAAHQSAVSPIPVFIFDDCSKDRTIEVAREKVRAFPLRIFRQPRNGGEQVNTNSAMVVLHQLGFEWVLLVHQDDLMGAWLEHLLEILESRRPGMGMICSGNSYVNLERGDLAAEMLQRPADPPLLYHPGNVETIVSLHERWFWNMSGSCIRPDAYIKLGGLHTTLKCCGDNDFIVRFLEGGYGILEAQWPAMLKRFSAGSQTSNALRTAADLSGWSYIMFKFLDYSSRPERFVESCSYLYKCARRSLSFAKRGDWKAVWAQAVGFVGLARSLAALFLGKWLLPLQVKKFLEYKFEPLTSDCGVEEIR